MPRVAWPLLVAFALLLGADSISDGASAQEERSGVFLVASEMRDERVTAIWFVDETRLFNTDRAGVRRAWIDTYYSPTAHEGPWRVLVLMDFFCEARSFRVAQSTAYHGDGTLAGVDDRPTRFSFVTPGSMGESALDFVCAYPALNRADVVEVPVGLEIASVARYMFEQR